MARIVVVDDEAAWRQLCEQKLSEQGHEVTSTGDCLYALMEMQRAAPDLVVLDLRMPITGRTMLHAIQEDLPRIPVVVHTVYAGYRDDPAYSRAAGFAEKKPDLTELADVVDRVLRSRRSQEPEPQAKAGGNECR